MRPIETERRGTHRENHHIQVPLMSILAICYHPEIICKKGQKEKQTIAKSETLDHIFKDSALVKRYQRRSEILWLYLPDARRMLEKCMALK